MKKKLTTLLFGLLLAVGWTSVAQAQKLAEPVFSQSPLFKILGKPSAHEKMTGQPTEMIQARDFDGADGSTTSTRRLAPRRAYTFKSDVVHPKSWYDSRSYTWYDVNENPHTAYYSDAVTDSCQMYWFIRSIYTNKEIPGIKFSETNDADVIYRGVDWGYFISGPVTEDIGITMTPNVQINAIAVYDLYGNEITSYYASQYYQNTSSVPSGWEIRSSSSVGVSREYNYDAGGYYYYWYWNNSTMTETSFYRLFNISKDLLEGYNGVYVLVRAKQNGENGTSRTYTYSIPYDFTNGYLGEKHELSNDWTITRTMYTFPIEEPTDNGYSIVLVKLSDKFDALNDRAPIYTYSVSDLYSYYNKYISEMQLLTDGLRVGEGTSSAGTVFAYTGILDKFFFIGKGKTYPIATKYSSSENRWTTSDGEYTRYADRAPFYSMYEEFSPDVESSNTNIKDLYADMYVGQYYPILHDCQSVMRMRHYFTMSGKDTIGTKSVSSLVLYIPDERGDSATNRTYDLEHQPQLGIYTIRLSAETEPASTYAQDSMYTVTLDWTSNLNEMVNNNINQTYIIYTVTFDEHGNRVYEPLDTLVNPESLVYSYNVKQQLSSQQITYVILGYPTDATNNYAVGGIFFTYSNLDDVQIPGLFDFMVLYRERYESDFVISEEKNYYRNYLYPTNLTPGTGMTMGQLKQEWPNQTASYTLWRDNTGVAVLEVRGIGDKVYYRIRYYDDTQVKTGPNNITVPNYQTMDNN